MKLSAATCRRPARKRFPPLLESNEATATAMNLTDVTPSVMISQDGFASVVRRCLAFHGSLFGGLHEIQGVAREGIDTLAEIVQSRAKPDKMAVTKLWLTKIVGLRYPPVIVDIRNSEPLRTSRPVRNSSGYDRPRALGCAGYERFVIPAIVRSTIRCSPIRVQLNSVVWRRNRKPGE